MLPMYRVQHAVRQVQTIAERLIELSLDEPEKGRPKRRKFWRLHGGGRSLYRTCLISEIPC
jgi:hypothetical protein